MFDTKHAVVIGGSLAGLFAARVLSDHFQQVTIIEKYQLTESEKRAPQGNHLHILATKGASILQALFPSLSEALIKNGAYKVDLAQDWRYFIFGRKPSVKSGRYSFLVSRPLLEDTIRSIVKNYSNIAFMDEMEAQRLLRSKDKITGVSVISKKTNEELNLYADLIVDASGRNTDCPYWLEAVGYQKPYKREVKIDLVYLSRIYRWPEHYHPEWKAMLVKGVAPCKKTGSITAIENDAEGKRWLVTLAGQHGDYPVNTEEGFLEFAKNLAEPDLYEAIKNAEPLTKAVMYKFPAIQRYCYEDLTQLPKGFIALGDALCAVSPVFGIGMTVAALAADTLNQVLSENEGNYPDNLEQDYFKRTAKLIKNAWNLNVNQEYAFEELKSERTFPINVMNWYRRHMLQLCNNNPDMWNRVYTVISLEKPLINLFHPSILLRVLLHAMSGK